MFYIKCYTTWNYRNDETYIGGKEKNKHECKKLKQGRGATGKVAVMGAISRKDKQASVPSVASE